MGSVHVQIIDRGDENARILYLDRRNLFICIFCCISAKLRLSLSFVWSHHDALVCDDLLTHGYHIPHSYLSGIGILLLYTLLSRRRMLLIS